MQINGEAGGDWVNLAKGRFENRIFILLEKVFVILKLSFAFENIHSLFYSFIQRNRKHLFGRNIWGRSSTTSRFQRREIQQTLNHRLYGLCFDTILIYLVLLLKTRKPTKERQTSSKGIFLSKSVAEIEMINTL